MANDHMTRRPPLTAWTGVCLAAGFILGAVLGNMFDMVYTGIGVGVTIGIIIGAILMKHDTSGGVV